MFQGLNTPIFRSLTPSRTFLHRKEKLVLNPGNYLFKEKTKRIKIVGRQSHETLCRSWEHARWLCAQSPCTVMVRRSAAGSGHTHTAASFPANHLCTLCFGEALKRWEGTEWRASVLRHFQVKHNLLAMVQNNTKIKVWLYTHS